MTVVDGLLALSAEVLAARDEYGTGKAHPDPNWDYPDAECFRWDPGWREKR